MSYPSIYPTGTTIYDPDKCFNGYTLYQAKEHGALLIDMNGGEVNLWPGDGPFGSAAQSVCLDGMDGSGAGGLGRQYRLEVRPF